jgi:dipeptide/tripeptide permease
VTWYSWSSFVSFSAQRTVNYSSLQWVKHFLREEKVSLRNRWGWPAAIRAEGNIATIHQIVHENCWLIVRSLAEQVNIHRETVWKIWTEDFEMRKVCAKIIPKKLTEEQNQRRVAICLYIWRCKMIFWVTSSQAGINQYDPEMKQQSVQWKTANSTWPKEFR